MAERPLYTLYKNLKAQNFDVPDDYDKFENALTRDGKAGADNRHAIYESLKTQDFDVPDSYERFYSALFEPRSKNSSKAKGGSVPMSEADKTRFIVGSNNIVYNSKQQQNNTSRYTSMKQRRDKHKSDFGRVNVGSNKTIYGGDADNVIQDIDGGYLTSDGEKTDNQLEAQQRQAVLDEYGKQWNEAVRTGAVPSALDEADPNLTPLDIEKNQADREAEYIQSLFVPTMEEVEEKNDNPLYNMTRGGGIAAIPHNASTGNGLLADEKARQLIAARNQNAQRRKLLDLEQDTQNGSTWDNHSFWRGFADAAKEFDLWTGGVNGMLDATTMLSTKQDLVNGKRTTVGDVLMNATIRNASTQSKYGDDTSWVYDGGMITANMVPFMLQIAGSGFTEPFSQAIGKVTQGIASSAAKGIVRKTAGMVGMNAAKNIAKFTGLTAKAFGKTLEYGIVGAAQANTLGMARIGADAMNRHTGQVYQDEKGTYKFGTFDSEGNLVHEGGEDFLTSLVKGELAQTTEFATEMAGGSIDKFLGWVAKGGKKTLEKFGMDKVTKYVSALFDNRVTRAVDRSLGKFEINSIIGESMEEELGIIANSIFTGDNKISDLWDGKQQAQIWGGMFLSMGLMKAVASPVHAYNAAQYYRYKHKVDVADSNLSHVLGEGKWNDLRDRIDGTSNEDMTDAILNVLRDDTLGQNKAQVLDYIKNLLTMRGYDIGTMLNAQSAVSNNGQDIPARDMEQNQAYQQGHNADDSQKHNIQLEHNASATALAQMLGITEEQLHDMSDDELEAKTGQSDKLDQAIYDYQLSTARHQGMMDDANDKVDLAAQQAAIVVDQTTDLSRGTVRKATIKAMQGAEDYDVYIISGNIATHDDGTIDISGSDQMILYYDPTTGRKEYADPSRFASLGEEAPADLTKQVAVTAAKEKAIREIAGIIDGKVEVGTQFTVTDEQGNAHTYEILADNGDGTAMITIDGNVPTQLVNGENIQMPVSFDDLQQMKDSEDERMMAEARQKRAELEAQREQQKQEEEQRQAQSDEQLKAQYNNLLDNDGKVVMGTVHDGKHDDQLAFIVGINQSNKKPFVVFLNDDGTFTKPRSFKADQVERGEAIDFDTFKAMMPTAAVEEETTPTENETSTAVEDNSGENAQQEEEQSAKVVSSENFNPDDIDFENNYVVIHQTLADNIGSILKNGLRTIAGLNATSLFANAQTIKDLLKKMSEGHGHRGSDALIIMTFPKSMFGEGRVSLDDISTTLIEQGKAKDFTVPSNFISNVVTVDGQVQGGENTQQSEQQPSMTLEDGTVVPMLEDGNPDFSQLTAAQTAEIYDNQFGEDADGVISGWVTSAKNALDKANNMTVKGKNFVEQVASKKAKEEAIAEAQARYDSAVAIRDAYNERVLSKEEGTAEGRQNLIDKARRKYNRLKGAVKEDAAALQQLYKDTVGSLLHRLYDGTGIDVTDTAPLTAEEYVASNLSPFSLNYEGTDTAKGVRQETGLSRDDFAKTRLLAKDGKGTTIDALVHTLWNERPSNLDNLTTQDIRNALLTVITNGFNAKEARNYVENARIAQAEKMLEEQQRAADNAAYEEEQRKAAEEQRKAEEEQRRAEEERLAAEEAQRKAEEELRNAEEEQPASDSEQQEQVPEDGTSDMPFGGQLSEEELPFSARGNAPVETTEQRKARVERERVENMDVVDDIIGKKMRKSLARIAKMMGATIQYQYTDTTGNGWYDPSTNTVYLTLDSSITEGVQFIFGHEMTHEIKTKNPEAYEELRQLVKDMMGEDSFDALTEATRQKYENAGVIYTEGTPAYEEEVVADQLGTWLQDANYAHTLALKMSHPLLAKLHEIVNRIRMAFTGTQYNDNAKIILRSIEQAYIQTSNHEAANAATREGEGGNRFSLRQKPAPNKTQKVYKLMRMNPAEEGKLFPLFIGNGEAVELGKWYDADSPKLQDLKSLSSKDYVGTRTVSRGGKKVKEEYNYGSYLVNNQTGEATSLADFKAKHKGDKAYSRMGNNPNVAALNWATDNGYRWIKIEEKNQGQSRYGGENRSYYNYGINGTGQVSIFAMRPGWHAGSLPTMRQIGKGKDSNLRDDNFIWVEGEIPADIDYNEEAQGNADKDIPDHIPTDGFYLKATNANKEASQADKVGWYVAGAFKPNRIMSDKETREVIDRWNAAHPNDEKVQYDWKRESGKDFNAETMSLEDTPKFSLKQEKVDNQGNPLNEDGTLKLDKIKSVDELTDEDFLHPTRNVLMPALPKKVADAIGTDGRSVVIKKNIFGRNHLRHKDVTPEQSKIIFNSALYNPDMYGQNQKTNRPYNWVLINTKDEKGKNRTVLLEVNPNKDNVEIVHWYFVNDKNLEMIKKQAIREGDQVLILPSEQSEEVGGLSNLTDGLSAAKIDKSSETSKENAEKVDSEGQKFSLKDEPDTNLQSASLAGEVDNHPMLNAIHTLYTKGKDFAAKLFNMKYFDVAKTPDFMKEVGLTGDKFTIRYGVISRHFGKDEQHDFTEEEWKQLPKALSNPILITEYYQDENQQKQKGYRLYTPLTLSDGSNVVVSAEVKNAGRNLEINAINTIFGRNAVSDVHDKVVWQNPKITPEQSSLLNGNNPHQYPNAQELSAAKVDNSPETSKENEEKVDGERQKFSLKDDKTMFGMHNITLDKLRKAIKQGGFAAPSMGVIDSKNGIYSDYGEITLIPKSEKLAKSKGKNAGTFTADGWTPTYPEIVLEATNEGKDRIIQDTVGNDAMDADMSSDMKRFWDNYLDGHGNKLAFAYQFLHETGKNPKVEKYAKEYPASMSKKVLAIKTKDGFKRYDDDLSEDEIGSLIKLHNQWLDESGEGAPTEQNVKNMVEDLGKYADSMKDGSAYKNNILESKKYWEKFGGDKNTALTWANKVVASSKKQGKTDVGATNQKAMEKVRNNSKLNAEFDKWFDDKMKEYGVSEMLFAGRTPSGKSKYLPNTIENAIKIMKKQDLAGGYSVFKPGVGAFIAKYAPMANTLSAMKKAKDKLIPFGDKRHEEMRTYIMGEFNELSKALTIDPNSAWDDSGEYRLQELAEVKPKDMKGYIESNWHKYVSDDWVEQYDNLVDTIKNDYPVFYFETKFMRPYGLDEFEKAIVPKGTPKDVVDALQKAGIDVRTYEGKEDREKVTMDAVSSSDNIRFSLAGERGAANMDKAEEVTTRLDNLGVARKMEEAKKDAKAIKLATGWERGADGKWRYEIPDIKQVDMEGNLLYRKNHPDYARYQDLVDKQNRFDFELSDEDLTAAERKEKEELAKKYEDYTGRKMDNHHQLAAYVDAPELFKAYPQLADIKLRFVHMEQNPEVGGWFDMDNNAITLNTANKVMNGNPKSTLVHELQHAIQGIEGFAKGGSPDSVRERIENLMKDLEEDANLSKDSLEEYRNIRTHLVQLQLAKQWEKNPKAFLKDSAKYTAPGYYPGVSKKEQIEIGQKLAEKWKLDANKYVMSRSYWRDAEDVDTQDNEKLLSKWAKVMSEQYSDGKETADKFDKLDKALQSLTDIELYHTLAGEVEARNAQKRMDMTDEERRNSLASETEDVDRGDQIILNNGGVSYSVVRDPKEIERLNNGETFPMYSAMQTIDDGLYSPMAAVIGGKRTDPVKMGEWHKADEHPELVNDDGTFTLVKTDKKKGAGEGDVPAAYNPYMHVSSSMMNDQFTGAYARGNIRVIEWRIPKSELTSGYHAEKAKDSVGMLPWHSGTVNGLLPRDKQRKVMLSRWRQAVRYVPDSEVAERVAKQIEGTDLVLPFNIFTPNQIRELAKIGAPISTVEAGTVGKETKDKFLQQKAELEKEFPQAQFVDKKMTQDAYLKWGTNEEVKNDIKQRKKEAARKRAAEKKAKGILKFSIADNGTDVADGNGDSMNQNPNKDVITRRIGSRAQAQRRVNETLGAAADNFRRNQATAAEKQQGTWDRGPVLGYVIRAAKANSSFIPEEELGKIIGKSIGHGEENFVYHAKYDPTKVVKLNDFTMTDGLFRINEFIDRINAHNQFMPEDRYTPLGFAYNHKGDPCIVMEQPYVKGTQPTREEITKYLTDHGFELDMIQISENESDLGWTNGEFDLWDAEPRNVIKDENGDLHFFDTMIQHTDIPNHKNPLRLSKPSIRTFEAQEMKVSADKVQNVANDLGGAKATTYASASEVPEEYKVAVEQGAKGWYDPETHTVHVYLPNCADANDAQRTVFHEKVGHEGMEVLLGGEQGVRKFADFVYRSVGKETRGKILDFANKYDPDWKNHDRTNVGTQEYIAHLAEEGPTTAEDFSLWTKIKHYLIKALKKLGIRVPGLLNDKDLRYYLMKAGKALHVWDNMPKEKQEAMMQQASDAEVKKAIAEEGGDKGKSRKEFDDSEIDEVPKHLSEVADEMNDMDYLKAKKKVLDPKDLETAMPLIRQLGTADDTTPRVGKEGTVTDKESIANQIAGKINSLHLLDSDYVPLKAADILNEQVLPFFEKEIPGSKKYEDRLAKEAMLAPIRSERGKIDAATGVFKHAPNGEQTNLSKKQYIEVRTKAFKEWFGGDWEENPRDFKGKLDDKGEPLEKYVEGFMNRPKKPTMPKKRKGEDDATFFERKMLYAQALEDFPKTEADWKKRIDEFDESELASITPPDEEAIREKYRKQYEDDMTKWRKKHHIDEGEEKPEKYPDMGDFASLKDYAEALRKHETWKIVPNKDEYDRMAEDEIVSKVALMDAVRHPFSDYARMKAMNAEFQHMRHVMQNQKVYDKNTANAVVQFAKRFMSLGFGDDLGRNSINSLLSIVKNSVGKESSHIPQQLYKVMDVMMDNQLRNFENAVVKTMSIKALKENAKGIQVQGKLELRGQATIKSFRDAIASRMSSDRLDEKIGELIDRMMNDKENASSYQDELLGLNLAKQYVDYIDSSRIDASKTEDMRKKEIEDYNKRQGAYKNGLTDILRREHVERLNAYDEAIFNNKVERMQRYSQLFSNLGGMIDESVKGAKEFLERDTRRAINVKMLASADLGDKSMNQHRKENWKTRLSNGNAQRLFCSPLGSFDALMREFGSKDINGEGALWNHFVRGVQNASNAEYKSVKEACKEIDLKVSELFGKVAEDKNGDKKGNMTLNDLYSLERSKNVKSLDVTIHDIEGDKTYKLQQGNLMYIYMVNKMTDGAMKLREMGILEADVERIKESIDPRFLKLADWIQGEFLPKMRTKYNKRHEELFGAPMPIVENYFPLRVLKNARYMEEDVNNMSDGSSTLPSTATGAIIKRKVNRLPLDILNADALSVTIDNINEMENWYNFAPIRKDANTLLSDTAFRNRVQNLTTIYGSGERLWNNVKDATAVAMGTYRPKGGTDLAVSLKNIGKGITGAKISFRLYTAFKQILSAPLFFADADLGRFAWYSINPYGSFKWAIENMPGFDKRWSGRKLGDTVLMNDPTDWKLWHNKLVEKAAYYGMTPNALVDAVTCAIGARAVYDTKYKHYIQAGLTEERAKEKALSDAEINFNTSQQSSENAFVSPMQLDRTLESAIFTPFRNSSMLYERKGLNALRNLKHRFEKGHKEASIKFMAGQLMEEGVGYEQATKAAERMYRKGLLHNIADAIVPLWLGPIVWNLGGSLGYLLLGDDGENKKKSVLDAIILGLIEGPVDGLAGGQFIATAISNTITSDGINIKGLKNLDVSGMPMLSDFNTMIEKFGYDKVAGVQDLMFMVMQSGTGFNPRTLTDAVNACIDYGNGDMLKAKEIALFMFRLMNGPVATTDNLYIDEIGMNSKDARKLSYEELAKRYAEYKFKKNTLDFGGFLYSDEEKQKKLKAIEKSFDKKVSERLAGMDREDLKGEFTESRSQREKKLIGKIIAEELETKDSEATKKAKADAAYLRQRNFEDLMDDLYLQKEWESTADANAGLEELKDNGASQDEITSYKTHHKLELDKRKTIQSARKAMQKKKADISSDKDEATMAAIRKLRSEALKTVRQKK